MTLVLQHPEPVITTRTSGAEGNRFGFEGGRAVKVGATYHLFTSEMIVQPDVGADAAGLLDQPGSSPLDARGDHPRIEC